MEYLLAFLNRLPVFLFLIILGLIIFRKIRMIINQKSLDQMVKKEFKNFVFNKYRITLLVIMCLVIIAGTHLIVNNTEDIYFQLEFYNFAILCICIVVYISLLINKSFLNRYVTSNSISISSRYKQFYKVLNILTVVTIILTVSDLIIFWGLIQGY